MRYSVFTDTQATLSSSDITLSVADCTFPEAIEFRRLDPEYTLYLMLSPRPDTLECSISERRSNQYMDIGYVSLRPAQIPYRQRNADGIYRYIQLNFSHRRFDELTGIGTNWDPRDGCDIRGTFLDTYMLRLAREAVTPTFAGQLLIEGLTHAIYADLANVLRKACGGPKISGGKLSRAQVRMIDEVVDTVEGASATIDDLARLVGISRRHLTHLFKRTTGQTIHEYVAHRRLQRARSMLSGTDLAVKDIAYRLGFSRAEAFTTAFSAATGQTPTSFRREFAKT